MVFVAFARSYLFVLLHLVQGWAWLSVCTNCVCAYVFAVVGVRALYLIVYVCVCVWMYRNVQESVSRKSMFLLLLLRKKWWEKPNRNENDKVDITMLSQSLPFHMHRKERKTNFFEELCVQRKSHLFNENERWRRKKNWHDFSYLFETFLTFDPEIMLHVWISTWTIRISEETNDSQPEKGKKKTTQNRFDSLNKLGALPLLSLQESGL